MSQTKIPANAIKLVESIASEDLRDSQAFLIQSLVNDSDFKWPCQNFTDIWKQTSCDSAYFEAELGKSFSESLVPLYSTIDSIQRDCNQASTRSATLLPSEKAKDDESLSEEYDEASQTHQLAQKLDLVTDKFLDSLFSETITQTQESQNPHKLFAGVNFPKHVIESAKKRFDQIMKEYKT
ncbi:uncharacterized protein MONOS_7286 [Monocercomonoides exilis]|uniref:uncharacterized protein n=1 Tax=Monocercomonoides exilis TaxID=2049356 RepID=UPI00355A044A|nr:hypothetical protein MONOS_7286 [Monocercomonoides exilis]|eukprot:MONOS_7286.1-p1 / transcript=MONOS_7286.1 / gene=MONOS_7286 / organism=Monocercomonoides_exilis_PA203 / gene_product=unspecified product / transcript_product=unspecified product / location=Mono_scaffold00246:22780-23738(-) / protein_length=181 / sequence_SO=supercontig / SO=protein_coding / is_pseudo=false